MVDEVFVVDLVLAFFEQGLELLGVLITAFWPDCPDPKNSL